MRARAVTLGKFAHAGQLNPVAEAHLFPAPKRIPGAFRHCLGLTLDGNQCYMPARRNGYCHQHPDQAPARA